MKAEDRSQETGARRQEPEGRSQKARGRMIVSLDGARRLVAAIIIAAVHDYRGMARRGMIVDGKPNVPKRGRRYGAYKHAAEVKSLIRFFHAGTQSTLQFWLDLARFKISADRIRDALNDKALLNAPEKEDEG
jgi:hypothetical protein